MENIISNLSDEQKSTYFNEPAPLHLAQFEGQTNGQLLYAQISELADKLHPKSSSLNFKNFMEEHAKLRDDLLKTVVGEEYFKTYMADLESLRQKRQSEIMQQTEHLYHFSQIPPSIFGEYLLTHPQERGNALSEKVDESLCYASTEPQSHYIIKPPSSNPSEYSGVSCYMDEKVVLITGHDPQDFLSKQQLSYRYEVDPKTFVPNVSLDGRFTNEFESKENARVLSVVGPFSVSDMCKSKENGGWDIPVYFCPNKDNKPDIVQKINELRGIGVSRTNALRQVHEQMPSKLILLNENQELLNQVNKLEEKQEKEPKKEETKNINRQLQEKLEAEKARSAVLIKRGLQNPKNQKAAQQTADKKIAKTGQGLNEENMKQIKAKIVSKNR